MTNKPRLGWLDLETTGFTELNKKMVYEHKILEISLVITDSNFELIANLNQVIHHDRSIIMPLCDDVVTKMHTSNNLFEEVELSVLTLSEAENNAIQFMKVHGIERRVSPLCGNGVNFDRIFLEAQMPRLNDHFHYRNIDISSTKEFIKTISADIEPKKKAAHRAMPDIMESISEAKHYRRIITPSIHNFLKNKCDAGIDLL